MEYWLEVLEKPYIKETTYYLYKRNIKKHLAPALGDMFLDGRPIEVIVGAQHASWSMPSAQEHIGSCRKTITCHPYRHNYQRYVVYCERVV